LSQGRNLHEEQYGFREERSTVDAVLRVRSLTEAEVRDGGVALTVSLDIANAFNTLPWDRVGNALQHHGVSRYFVGVINAYFRDRRLGFVGPDGLRHRRSICCGVPQGSVLGPLLWKIAYDRILCLPLPRGCHAICYADDTRGSYRIGETLARTTAVARVVRGITDMGLKVVAHKTKALFFYGKSSGQPPSAHIGIGGTSILVGYRLKYLGLLLDGKWSFGLHFEVLAPRVERARLLPKFRSPDGRISRIYMGTVNSVALYGSPVWAADLAVIRHAKDRFRRVQRCMAARVVRAYRTVSHAPATVLAGWPPLELLAEMYAVLSARAGAPGWSGKEVAHEDKEGHPAPRPTVPRGEVECPPLRPTYYGSVDRRGHPALSWRVARQGSRNGHFPSDAGAHRAWLLW